MQLFFVFLLSIFLSMVLVAILMKWAPVLGMIDEPNARKVHKAVIPRVGGLGMLIGTLTCIVLWLDWSHDILVFVLGVSIIGIFGAWDDRCDLGYKTKFLGQIIASLVVVSSAHILIDGFNLGVEVSIPLLIAYPLTVFFLLGMTNAMNLSDGLDGLAGGLSLLSLVAMAFLADLANATSLLAIVIILMGAILGFLRYNTHPALVFMGDTGSQFLGFALGVLALKLTQSEDVPYSRLLPLLILGLPIVDTLTVMVNRIREGRSPFKPDKTHFHHKLMQLGFDHYESVVVVYAVQIVFIVSAYLMRYESDFAVLAFYLAYSALVVSFVPVMRWMLRRLNILNRKKISFLTRVINRAVLGASFVQSPRVLLTLVIPGFLIVTSILSAPASIDMAILALLLLGGVAVGMLFPGPAGAWLERIAIYCCAILVVYLSEIPAAAEICQSVLRGFLLALGIVTAVAVRFGGRELFELTPSDFLIIFVLVAAANLPVFEGVNYAAIAVETAVVLYGVECVLRRPTKVIFRLRLGTMVALTVVGIKGLFGLSIMS